MSGIGERIAAIEGDREHGAAELTRRSAEVLIAAASQGLPVAEVAQRLHRAQPAMAPIWNLGRAATGAADAAAACRDFISRMDRAVDTIAQRAASLAGAGAVVLTHSASEVVFAALRRARVRVIATESRPLGEGVEFARRLLEAGVQTTLVPDAAIARAMAAADMAFVGADSVTPASVINKVGTRLVALAARDAAKPVYALCPTMKFWDLEPPLGDLFEGTPRAWFRAIVTEAEL